jgi:hypothetical protein
MTPSETQELIEATEKRLEHDPLYRSHLRKAAERKRIIMDQLRREFARRQAKAYAKVLDPLTAPANLVPEPKPEGLAMTAMLVKRQLDRRGKIAIT